jgi:hypothetical protein
MDEVKEALKVRYSEVHPLIFQRALEKTFSNGDLFDILDTLPEFPIVWDDKNHCFVHTDILQTQVGS